MTDEADIIQAGLSDLSHSDLFTFLYKYCPDIEKLFGNLSSFEQLDSYMKGFLANRYIAIKGQVQSGKTAFMICASMMTLLAGYDALIVLRNSNSDLQQISSRLSSFRLELLSRFGTSFDMTTSKKPKKSHTPQVVLCLANGISLEKVFSIVDKSYVLIVDEADHVDSGTLTRKAVVLPMLKSQAHCVLGVSATVMDLLGKESMMPKDLLLLTPPPSYKGIPYLLEKAEASIPPGVVYSSKVDSNLLENDPYLLDWIEELTELKIEEQPVIALVTICDTVEPCVKAREAIVERFAERVVVLDHHAEGIMVKHGMIEYETKESISDVLQDLKDLNYDIPILIFAGDIAGRGVSYVSKDYGWHLTHQRLVVSKSCPEPELMQKVRLCGVYKDDAPLRLVTSQEILQDLRKAYYKQEELVEKVRGAAELFQGKCKDFFKEIIFEKEKMSGRHITKDPKAKPDLQLVNFPVGWEYGVRDMETEKDYPKKEYERLVNKMFPRWSSDESTNISRFIQNLEPEKEYTHAEILELCEETGIGKKNLKNLTIVSTGKSNGYGMILKVENNRYLLYECLREAYRAYFEAR
jgi:predicted nucleic-acid-binding Zn-ribbon protein